MTYLIDLIGNLVLIIFLTTFLELMMPSGSMHGFVKVVTGLFILLAILNPILQIINQENFFDIPICSISSNIPPNYNLIGEQNEKLAEVNQKLLWQNYQNKLELQIKSLLNLIPDLENPKVQILWQQNEAKNKNDDQLISKVNILLSQSAANPEEKEDIIRTKIVQTLSQYFNLNEDIIQVNFI